MEQSRTGLEAQIEAVEADLLELIRYVLAHKEMAPWHRKDCLNAIEFLQERWLQLSKQSIQALERRIERALEPVEW